jgi:cellulose synthase (UDP-forming)
VALWLVALVYFWAWWFNPAHYTGPFGYFAATATVAWVTLLPAYFMAIFYRARIQAVASCACRREAGWRWSSPRRRPSRSRRREDAEGMLAQDVPHDTWLADEDPSQETLDWCRRHGVFVSTRKGRADYHRPNWPRRTRCKEGNLAFFYDQYGYARYDFVVQLDADHVPEPGYLWQMLRPFSDHHVGYVSAPSICDSNAAKAGRRAAASMPKPACMALCRRATMAGWRRLCIGSHYAVRTPR